MAPSPRDAVAVALCAALLCACRPAAPPVTAGELARRGDLFEALVVAKKGDELERAARDGFAALAPEVAVEPLDFDELAPVVGRSTARRLLRGWVVARTTLGTRVGSPERLSLDLALAGPGGVVPPSPTDERTLAELTGEAYPLGQSHSSLHTDSPWPLTVLTGGVLGLLMLRVETTHTPPLREQVRAAIPRALRLGALLEKKCQAGRCTAGVIWRRPANEALSLALRVTVATGSDSPAASAYVNAPLAEGATIEAQLRATRPSRPASGLVGSGRQGPRAYPCSPVGGVRLPDCEEPLALSPWPPLAAGGQGLKLPERPATLGSPSTSAARRPPWGGSTYAPLHSLPPGKHTPTDREAVEGGLLACSLKDIRVPGEDSDRVDARLSLDGTWMLPRSFTAPLVHLGPKDRPRISFWDYDTLSGADFLAELTLRREGGRLVFGPRDVRPRNARVDFECSLYDREVVESEFAGAWYGAADALEEAEEGYRITFGASDFGFGKNGLPRARDRVTNTAALVGWDDPRVSALVRRYEGLEAGFYLELRRALERAPQAEGGAIDVGRFGDNLRVYGISARCDARPAGVRPDEREACAPCFIDLEVENRGPHAIDSLALKLSPPSLVLDNGRVLKANAPVSPRVAVALGERVRLTVEAKRPREACAAQPWALIHTDAGAKTFSWARLPTP